VTDGSKPYLVAHATGVQIYSCNGTAWTLVAPRADLYGDNGKRIGTHSGGPTWTARDGSYVKARRDAGVKVDATAIDWLRLVATENGGSDGDRFAGTTNIQRIHTVGGLAPNGGACATPGAVTEVPYTADYVFWK